MGVWGDINLTWKFAIILGGSIGLAFFAGLAKLVVIRRRIAKHQEREDLEAKGKSISQVALNRRVLGEGDLFGVRAIEKGFYGGVSQVTLTPPDSSASSSHSSPLEGSLMGNSFTDTSLSKKLSPTTLATSNSRKQVPSPISVRLQPSYAELNGQNKHEPSTAWRTYIPSSPQSLRTLGSSNESVTEEIQRMPASAKRLAQRQYTPGLLDGQTAHPHSPTFISRPEPQFTREYVSTHSNPAASVKSEAAPVSVFELPARPDPMLLRSSNLNIFPNKSHLQLRPVLVSPPSNRTQEYIPPVPHSLRVPPVPFSPDSLDSPTIQLRAISAVSVWGDDVLQELAKNKRQTQTSYVSVQTSIDDPNFTYRAKNYNCDSTSTSSTEGHGHRFPPKSHSRENSGSSTSSDSSKRGIKRTQDSLRRYSRSSSKDSMRGRTSNSSSRRSLQRDLMHYDPSANRRAFSGSILARREIDFDYPRSLPFSPSPFDDSNAIPGNTPVAQPAKDTTLRAPSLFLQPQSRATSKKSRALSTYTPGSNFKRNVQLSVAETVTMVPPVSSRFGSRPPNLRKERSTSRGMGMNKVPRRVETTEAYYKAVKLETSHRAGTNGNTREGMAKAEREGRNIQVEMSVALSMASGDRKKDNDGEGGVFRSEKSKSLKKSEALKRRSSAGWGKLTG